MGEELATGEDDEAEEEDKPENPETPLGPDPENLPEQQVRETAVKGIYLRRADFAKHGWTEGCAKCRFMLLHPNREGGPIHTNACKKRLIDAIKTTPAGKKKSATSRAS